MGRHLELWGRHMECANKNLVQIVAPPKEKKVNIICKKTRFHLMLIHLLFPSTDSWPSQCALLGLG